MIAAIKLLEWHLKNRENSIKLIEDQDPESYQELIEKEKQEIKEIQDALVIIREKTQKVGLNSKKY